MTAAAVLAATDSLRMVSNQREEVEKIVKELEEPSSVIEDPSKNYSKVDRKLDVTKPMRNFPTERKQFSGALEKSNSESESSVNKLGPPRSKGENQDPFRSEASRIDISQGRDQNLMENTGRQKKKDKLSGLNKPKAKAMDKDVPVTIIWDSVAATSPKAELTGDYDKESIGLQARAISKGMRKITGVIANEKVLMVCLNQIRTKVGVLYGDPTTTPGGMAIPFHSSVRIKLGAGSQILNKNKEPIGINVSAKTIKNKVSAPFRKCDFEIHFGKGIKEHEQVFDVLRKHGPEIVGNYNIEVSGTGAWKNLCVITQDNGDVIVDKKFYKSDFNEIICHPEYGKYIEMILESAMIRKNETDDPDIDPESYTEIQEVANQVMETHSDAFEMLK